jgi:hypothetical protein
MLNLNASAQSNLMIAIRQAMRKTTTPGLNWWDILSIDAMINTGVALGWLLRTSTSQVEWTESGVKACDELIKLTGRYEIRCVANHWLVYDKEINFCVDRFGVIDGLGSLTEAEAIAVVRHLEANDEEILLSRMAIGKAKKAPSRAERKRANAEADNQATGE